MIKEHNKRKAGTLSILQVKQPSLPKVAPSNDLPLLCYYEDIPVLPALGGRCVTPGDILFLCREGWASGKRLGFPSELTGLL